MWRNLQTSSWTEFQEQTSKLLQLPFAASEAYYFRGQANSAWRLEPSLNRLFPPEVTIEAALGIEDSGLQRFKEQAHLHLPGSLIPGARTEPGDQFIANWWALMQHHHAPTRLLDWSLSPFVALYFAAESNHASDGVVYVVHQNTVAKSAADHLPGGKIKSETLCSPDAPQAVLPWKSSRQSERQVAQQGVFTFAFNLLSSQEEIICDTCENVRAGTSKQLLNERWYIPAEKKLEFLRRLRQMNIAAHSLFPGIDGLGRSLAEAARLGSSPSEVRIESV